jgi:putative endonuclease
MLFIFPTISPKEQIGKMIMKKYYIYILTSKKNGTIYTGFTRTLKKRVYEHRIGINEGFTKKYGIKSLVYFEEHSLVDTAIVREKRIKNWRRSWKVRLIESMNPDWKDLYDEIPNY